MALLNNQYSASRADLPFISALLFAAGPLFYKHAGRKKRNHVLSRGCVHECVRMVVIKDGNVQMKLLDVGCK